MDGHLSNGVGCCLPIGVQHAWLPICSGAAGGWACKLSRAWGTLANYQMSMAMCVATIVAAPSRPTTQRRAVASVAPCRSGPPRQLAARLPASHAAGTCPRSGLRGFGGGRRSSAPRLGWADRGTTVRCGQYSEGGIRKRAIGSEGVGERVSLWLQQPIVTSTIRVGHGWVGRERDASLTTSSMGATVLPSICLHLMVLAAHPSGAC
jgi:hypothetical protein